MAQKFYNTIVWRKVFAYSLENYFRNKRDLYKLT